MNIEEQKFMALEGLHTWGNGVIEQAARLNDLQSRLASPNFVEVRRSFQRERQFFLTASRQLLAHVHWAERLSFLDNKNFSEFKSFGNDIKSLRDLNEHVIEYFEGAGQRRENWMSENDLGRADASSTVDQRIGGRLDWNELAAVTHRLLAKLSPMYMPKIQT